MKHTIPPYINNSTIEYLISERVRNQTDREMLRDKWFHKMSLRALEDKYECSLTHVKDVIYGYGDPLLIEAAKIDNKNMH